MDELTVKREGSNTVTVFVPDGHDTILIRWNGRHIDKPYSFLFDVPGTEATYQEEEPAEQG